MSPEQARGKTVDKRADIAENSWEEISFLKNAVYVASLVMFWV
jgi:hypothetical protein